MLSRLNFLGLKTEIVMLYMLFFFFWFLGLKTQFGVLFMNEKHAEFSGLPCRMFWVFRSKKTQFCVSFHA